MLRYISELIIPIIILVIVVMGIIEKKNILEIFTKRSFRGIANVNKNISVYIGNFNRSYFAQ